MPREAREITRADLIPVAQYAKERAERRRSLLPVKKLRRVNVGPHATFYFENFDTMWLQVHEMLYIEKGGEAQIPDELRAYNPLIPQGSELVATVMFEIEDPVRRAAILSKLGGIETAMFMTVNGAMIRGVPEGDLERTKADGKTSSVHFMHFPFTSAQIAAFRGAGAQVVLGFDHAHYGHMATLPDVVRTALAEDFAV
jgi:hypothetical protein